MTVTELERMNPAGELPFTTVLLDFVDGPQFLVYDPELSEYAVLVHRATGMLLHGGMIKSTPDPVSGHDSFQYVQRPLGVCPDRASFLMALATNAEEWSEVDASEEATAHFQHMMALQSTLSAAVPAQAEEVSLENRHTRKSKMLTLKVRVASGVQVSALPIGPWTASPEQITDREGKVVYHRAEETAPIKAVSSTETAGFLSSLRKLMGGNKR